VNHTFFNTMDQFLCSITFCVASESHAMLLFNVCLLTCQGYSLTVCVVFATENYKTLRKILQKYSKQLPITVDPKPNSSDGSRRGEHRQSTALILTEFRRYHFIAYYIVNGEKLEYVYCYCMITSRTLDKTSRILFYYSIILTCYQFVLTFSVLSDYFRMIQAGIQSVIIGITSSFGL